MNYITLAYFFFQKIFYILKTSHLSDLLQLGLNIKF